MIMEYKVGDAISFDGTKDVLMGIIKDIDRFCREKGLRYSLAYGSLIGAVRHKGFIPWDDDIDILMPRPDYNRFIREYEHPYYKCFSQELDPEWALNFGKLGDIRTVSIDSHGNKSAISVDIFILDGLPDTMESAQRMVAKVNRYHRLWSNQLVTRKLSLDRKYGLRKNAYIILAKMLHLVLPFRTLVKSMLGFKQSRPIDKSKYCVSLVGACTIYETEKMLDYIDAPYEDTTLMICRNYDYQLKMIYGDYMTLPSEEQRYNHEAEAYWIK